MIASGALVGLPSLADRPIDMTIGAMVLAGTRDSGWPLSQVYLRKNEKNG